MNIVFHDPKWVVIIGIGQARRIGAAALQHDRECR
jgi:hypothetical protein